MQRRSQNTADARAPFEKPNQRIGKLCRGVARIQPMPGHRMGTLCSENLSVQNAEATRGVCAAPENRGIFDPPRSILRLF